MPLTDIAELMEQMAALLAAAPLEAPATTAPEGESLLTPASAELNAPLRGYGQVYGPEGRMLLQLSRQARAEGAVELADLFAALEQGLRSGAFDVPATPRPAPRLGRYVYPVV